MTINAGELISILETHGHSASEMYWWIERYPKEWMRILHNSSIQDAVRDFHVCIAYQELDGIPTIR